MNLSVGVRKRELTRRVEGAGLAGAICQDTEEGLTSWGTSRQN